MTEIKYCIDDVPSEIRDLLMREVLFTHRAYTYNFDDLMLAAAIILQSSAMNGKDSNND